MKKIDLKRVVEKELVGRLMRCDYCGASYVIEEGDRIEMRRFEQITVRDWLTGPVLRCECGEETIQKSDLEKWDGKCEVEKKVGLKELTPMGVCDWLSGKIQKENTRHEVNMHTSRADGIYFRFEFDVTEDNMKQVYQAFGGKL